MTTFEGEWWSDYALNHMNSMFVNPFNIVQKASQDEILVDTSFLYFHLCYLVDLMT